MELAPSVVFIYLFISQTNPKVPNDPLCKVTTKQMRGNAMKRSTELYLVKLFVTEL